MSINYGMQTPSLNASPMYNKVRSHVPITLFISITMFCGTNNIMENILHIECSP
jgi:hypothetical protein